MRPATPLRRALSVTVLMPQQRGPPNLAPCKEVCRLSTRAISLQQAHGTMVQTQLTPSPGEPAGLWAWACFRWMGKVSTEF